MKLLLILFVDKPHLLLALDKLPTDSDGLPHSEVRSDTVVRKEVANHSNFIAERVEPHDERQTKSHTKTKDGLKKKSLVVASEKLVKKKADT